MGASPYRNCYSGKRTTGCLRGTARAARYLGRPAEPINFLQPVQTPDLGAQNQFGCMPPRDVLLTVGRTIVEATMSYRCRWFEYLAYRPLLARYFENDPRLHHVVAPKPRLTDRSYLPGAPPGPSTPPWFGLSL